ncbi:MAG: ATP-binding protein [Acidothermaceae bacterium]
MATVTVSFTPLPSHVRTARFIAASVARRAGVAENVLDEVRLAVSEACSLAVRLHRAHAPNVPIEMRLTDDVEQFRVQVVDAVSRPKPPDGDLDIGPLDLNDDTGSDDVGPDYAARDPSQPRGDSSAAIGKLAAALGPEEGSADLQARERIGLAVIVGLVDDVGVDYLDGGSVVTMSWPIQQEASASSQLGGSIF